MQDLLLEIGCEELPWRFILPGVRDLRQGVEALLRDHRIGFGGVREFATPRRLAVLLTGVQDRGEAVQEEITGPPVKVAFDPQGKPTKAALGFSRKTGVDLQQMKRVKTPRGEYLAAVIQRPGAESRAVLESGLPEVIKGLSFPKTMTWGKGFRFPRPVRWIVALWGRDVLRFSLDGIPASRASRGHLILSPDPVEIPEPALYERVLEKVFVVASWETRREILKKAVENAARPSGTVQEDQELLDEVVGLAEFPGAVLGHFPERYLRLPEDIVIQAAKAHQRYFSVRDARGNLAPCFVAGVNTVPENYPKVVPGLERVLVARLEDALFYFTEDTKKPLAEYAKDLKLMRWGPWSAHEKAQRARALALWIAEHTGADPEVVGRAGELFLCDLATSMIRDGKEFTSLEGVIGMHYARLSGEREEVALAIRDSRLPRFSGDALPGSLEGACLALADRLDTLVGALASGYEPSPTKDPLGIRRTVYAIIEIILGKKLQVSLDQLLSWAGKAFDGKATEAARALILSRLENFLSEREGIRYDMVDAAVGSGSDDLLDIAERARALWRAYTDDPGIFQGVAVGQKRVAKILEGAGDLPALDPGLFQEPQEERLQQAALRAAGPLQTAMQERDYPAALRVLLSLKSPIDEFFDRVFVMAEDARLRGNRLALLAEVRKLFLLYGDLSKIVVEGA